MGEGMMLGPLVLFATVMSLTPGPNVILVTASAANFGFRRAVPQMIGMTLGFGFMVMAVGLGLASLMQTVPGLHLALRYAGGAYLLYLALCIARAGPRTGAGPRVRPIGFVEAALFQWINPKGWVFALGALAAYTDVGGDVLRQTSVIALVLAAACLGSVALWAWLGSAIGRFLGSRRAQSAFNWTMAGLLVLSLAPVLG